jgi:hypothetical protein
VLASRLPIADFGEGVEEMKTAARDNIVETARSLAGTGSQAVACFTLRARLAARH